MTNRLLLITLVIWHHCSDVLTIRFGNGRISSFIALGVAGFPGVEVILAGCSFDNFFVLGYFKSFSNRLSCLYLWHKF